MYITRRRLIMGTIASALLCACGSTPPTPTVAPSASSPTVPTPPPTPLASTSPTAMATGTPTDKTKQVRVGLILQFTGVFSVIGEDQRAGFELALEHFRSEFPTIEITPVFQDEGQTTEDGINTTRRLVEREQVDILVGVVKSNVLYAIRDYVHASEVPLVVTNAGAHGITLDPQQRSPWIWRASFANGQVNYPMGQYAYEQLGYRNVTVMASDFVAGHEHAAGFMKRFTSLGGSVVKEIYPPLDTQDFSPYLQGIPSDTDAVWAFFAGADALRFVTQYTEFGIRDAIPLVGAGWLTGEQLLPQLGDAAEGIITSLHYSPLLETPENQRFVRDFSEKTKRVPSHDAYHGYLAGRIVLEAVRRAEIVGNNLSARRQALREALSEVTFVGPAGEFRFDSETHGAILTIYIRECARVNGQLGNRVIFSYPDVSDRVVAG